MEAQDEKKSKFGTWLKENAPGILNTIGGVLPEKGALGIVRNLLITDETIPEEKRIEGLKLMYDYERGMEEEMTKRITSFHQLENTQLLQEDLFTKRARPTRQYFWLILILLCYPISNWTTGSMIELPEIVLGGIFVDFGLYTWKRTEEKNNLVKGK